jgi:hypothetical protein
MAILAAPAAGAHSASDAFLDLTVERALNVKKTIVHGQWDIALRDLDFVMKLDSGDGRLTWGQVRRHQAQIEKYAYAHLHLVSSSGQACTLKPIRQMIDDHADGAYAALFFDITCAGLPKALLLDYRLFFSIDPSHRGILVMHTSGDVATAVLSPQNAEVSLAL